MLRFLFLTILGALLAAACSSGGSPTPTLSSFPDNDVSIPTRVGPSPTPAIQSSDDALNPVWSHLRQCLPVEVTQLDSREGAGEWFVQVATGSQPEYGLWRVNSSSGAVEPADELASDIDIFIGVPPSVTGLTQPQHGTAVLTDAQSIIYTPDPDFSGTDRFTYLAGDGVVESNITSVTVTVNSINDLPQPVEDTYRVTKGGVIDIGRGSGVLANDIDFDDDVLGAVLVEPPNQGSAPLQRDGSFTYNHDDSSSADDIFFYTLTDGRVDSTQLGRVVISVVSTKDAPVAVDDEYSVDEGNSLLAPPIQES